LNSAHLHLVIKLDDRKEFSKFVRVITGLIARHVLKAQRGPVAESSVAAKEKTQFWMARPFTRLIAWGRDYEPGRGSQEEEARKRKPGRGVWL
jgi:hypothetical protein